MARLRKTPKFVLFILARISRLGSALEVSPNSPCAPKCIDNATGNVFDWDSSKTYSYDLACYDREYTGKTSTQVGQKFRDCNNCLKSSGYLDTGSNEADIHWFLFNNRATMDWCLFGRFGEEKEEDITSSSIYKECNNDCNSISASTDYNIITDKRSYRFCNYSGNFTAQASTCQSCLYKQDGLTILGNVITTIQDLCVQQPGKVYAFQGDQDMYAATQIPAFASLSTSQSISETRAVISSTFSTGPSTSPIPPTEHTKSSNLTSGAIAGIVLGTVASVVLLFSAIIFCLRRRRQAKGVAEMKNAYGYDPTGKKQNEQYGYQVAEVQNTQVPVEIENGREVLELPANRL